MSSSEPTRTSAPRDEALDSGAQLGLMWVVPEERFVPFGATLIGRDAECGVCLEDDQISRRHARLEKQGPLWLIRDLGSKNGTWVNGRRETVAALEPQATLRIGAWVAVVCSMPAGGGTNPACFHQIPPGLCVSTPTRAALERVLELSRRDVPIALYGETGTGKDALAQAIHHASARPGRLVALNCAAIPEAMAEGMLFGHRKGAFTGAQTSEEGHVRAAHRGTLFLDEIADLSLGVQAKLLRVLEERQVTPLGATEPQPVDFRLIAACQEPLEALVAHGDFRADLYARLSGIELCLSPLRERRQEVPRLFSTFWSEAGRPAPRLEGPLVEALCGYDWPYNVREVRQLAQLLEASGKLQLGLADLPERLRLAPTPAALPAPERSVSRDVAEAPARRAAWLSRHARELDALQRALQQHDGNVSSAALEAGVPRHRARRLLAAQAEMHGSRK